MTPTFFQNLEHCIDTFLLQYGNAKHAKTGESPSKLSKNRALRTNMHSTSPDVTCFKGTRQEMARGVVMQNLGNRMVTIRRRRWVGSSSTLRPNPLTRSGNGARRWQQGVRGPGWTKWATTLHALQSSVVALSGTPISMASEEGPSAPMARQAADAWVPLKEPTRDVKRSKPYIQEIIAWINSCSLINVTGQCVYSTD